MFTKINVVSIVKDHTATLRNERSGNISIGEIFLFYIAPLVTGFVLVYANVLLDEKLVNIVIASLSIFVGLLLNLLAILMGQLDKYREQRIDLDSEENKTSPHATKKLKFINLKIRLLNETYYNISFAIIIAIVGIIALLFTFSKNAIVCKASNALSYSLIVCFLLTLVMVLKRVHIILKSDNV